MIACYLFPIDLFTFAALHDSDLEKCFLRVIGKKESFS
jgi:hypothetical protein